jgi:hypothetical protein
MRTGIKHLRCPRDLIVAKKWMKTPFDSKTGTGKKGFEGCEEFP